MEEGVRLFWKAERIPSGLNIEKSSISLTANAISSSSIAGRLGRLLSLFSSKTLILRPRARRLAVAGFDGDDSRKSRRRRGGIFFIEL